MNKIRFLVVLTTVFAIGLTMVNVVSAKEKSDSRPGWGWGDRNHTHTGPPGNSTFPFDKNELRRIIEFWREFDEFFHKMNFNFFHRG